MGLHPLIERSKDREVRQAKGFRQAAAELSGEALAKDYEDELAQAPRRSAAGRRYLANRTKPRRGSREDDQLAMALSRWCHANGPIALPDETAVAFLDFQIPLQSAQPDRADPSDPNLGIGKVDLLGLTDTGRLVVTALKYVAADGARVGTGDTPLRSLLETLASCAVVEANREALAAEVAERFEREPSDERPLLLVLGTARYWELSRRREAQKGAAWINQMERLQREIEEQFGVRVVYAGLELPAAPAWSDDEHGWPALGEPPRIQPAWDEFAGRVKPKPRPRPKSRPQPTEVIVEADPSRPVRAYAMTDSYTAGDRVEHPRFGVGVVQGVVGPGKIKIRFEGEPRVLVHERAPRPA